MPAIESRLDVRSDEFLNNARAMGGLVSDLRSQVDRAAAGGGDTARARQTARGKLLPRDRIDQPGVADLLASVDGDLLRAVEPGGESIPGADQPAPTVT